MSVTITSAVTIPSRSLFRASEVCEIAQVQSYVLRTWEAEFPDLGVAKIKGGPRVYRRADVERVLRLKHLLFVEGLTLAGARRKLEEETGPVAADEVPTLDELLTREVRERLADVKSGLRSILELLSRDGQRGDDFQLVGPRRRKTNTGPARGVTHKSSKRSAKRAKAGGGRFARA